MDRRGFMKILSAIPFIGNIFAPKPIFGNGHDGDLTLTPNQTLPPERWKSYEDLDLGEWTCVRQELADFSREKVRTMRKQKAALGEHLDDLDVLAYALDEPPFKERKSFKKHLSSCSECQRAIKKELAKSIDR